MTKWEVHEVRVISHYEIRYGDQYVIESDEREKADGLAAFLNGLLPQEQEPPPPPPPPDPDTVIVTYPGVRSQYVEPGDRFECPYNVPIHKRSQFSGRFHFAEYDFPHGFHSDHDIILVNPDAPLMPLLQNAGGFDPEVDRTIPISNEPLAMIRCSPEMEYLERSLPGPHKGNGCAVCLYEDGTLGHPYNLAKRRGQPPVAKSLQDKIWYPPIYVTHGAQIRGPMWVGSHGGGHLTAYPGTIMPGEMTPVKGPAMHALRHISPGRWRYRPPGMTAEPPIYPALKRHQIDYDDPNTIYVAPALNADRLAAYSNTTDVNLKAGALYALPHRMEDEMETDAGRMFAWTLYHYGSYDCDAAKDSLAFGFCWAFVDQGECVSSLKTFEREWAAVGISGLDGDPTGYVTSPYEGDTNRAAFARDLRKLFRNLQAVKSNRPGAWGGAAGHDRRAPYKADWA